jgi:DNA replication initiation complex subunit (GINS family)
MLDIKTLFTLLLNEVNTDSLQPIDKNLYVNIADLLAKMKGQGYEGLEKRIIDNLIEIISLIIDTLLSIRLSKYYTNPSNLTYEEIFIINTNEEYKVRREFIKQNIIEGRSKVLTTVIEKVKAKMIPIRLLTKIEEFEGVDKCKYGPYNAEDITILPLEDARRLINNGLANEILIMD